MNHRRARKYLNDYLEGELDIEQRALLDAHLSGCDDCACELRELRQTVFQLRALPTEQSPPGLAEAVMARVRAGDARPPRWVGLARRLSDSGGGLALAAGLGALLIVAILDPARIGPSTASSGGHPGAPEVSLDPEPISGQQVAETRPDPGTPTGTLGAQTQTTRPRPLRVQTAAASRNSGNRNSASRNPVNRSPARPRGTFASPLLPRPSNDLEAPSPSVDDLLDALLKNPEPFVLRMQRSLRVDRERAVDLLAQRAAMRGDDGEAVRKLGGVNQPNAPVLARLFESRAKAFRSRLR